MRWDTLVDLAQSRAADTGVGFTFLHDGSEPEMLSFRELDSRARVVASALGASIAEGSRAVLVHPWGSDFVTAFFGALYAGIVAVPMPPPPTMRRRGAWTAQLRRVVQDSQATAVLSTAAQVAALARVSTDRCGVRWIATDGLDGSPWDWPGRQASADDVAYIQYTSGSTSSPKGVVLKHRNLIANSRAIATSFGLSSSDCWVSWLPMFHDMGLVGGVLNPLYLGCAGVYLSPTDFLQRPARWLEAVSRFGGTFSGGPDFAYALCARRVTSEQKAGLNLSSWRVAFNGAEPVRAATLRQFADAFARCGLRSAALLPVYGLAESTLFACGARPGEGTRTKVLDGDALRAGTVRRCDPSEVGATEVVSCGVPPGDHRIAIVDPNSGLLLAAGRVGEIWIQGPSVAAGYWERDGDTEQTFHARLADRGGCFLRTGDLGFTLEGELHVIGRMKDLIIIRGRNVYPQDVEDAVQAADPRLRAGCGTAFAIESADRQQVAVVQEIDRALVEGAEDLLALVCQHVLETQQVALELLVLVPPRAIPRTSSGKLQRSACRRMYLAGELEVLARWARDGHG